MLHQDGDKLLCVVCKKESIMCDDSRFIGREHYCGECFVEPGVDYNSTGGSIKIIYFKHEHAENMLSRNRVYKGITTPITIKDLFITCGIVNSSGEFKRQKGGLYIDGLSITERDEEGDGMVKKGSGKLFLHKGKFKYRSNCALVFVGEENHS